MMLGAEHPDTLISLTSLASTYYEQDWWNEAERLHIQVLIRLSKIMLELWEPIKYVLFGASRLEYRTWGGKEESIEKYI